MFTRTTLNDVRDENLKVANNKHKPQVGLKNLRRSARVRGDVFIKESKCDNCGCSRYVTCGCRRGKKFYTKGLKDITKKDGSK